MSDQEYKHYWICYDCAEKRGWVGRDGVTIIMQECPNCGETTMLACASTDFAKNGKADVTWD